MKQPTVEELEKLINDYNWQGDPALVFAEQIHALYNPPLKPLSELHKDKEACGDLFHFFFGFQDELTISQCNDGVEIEGFKSEYVSERVIIKFNGEVLLLDWMGEEKEVNPFKYVDKIRELGYDVQPETEKG
jgi:hypothetical protein